MSTGKEEIYGTPGMPLWWLYCLEAAAAVTLLWTAFVVWKYLAKPTDPCWTQWFYVCWVWWVFAPPIWFSFEYFHLFKPHGDAASFEAFKYGQDLASRAWLGIAAVLTVIASK